MVELVAKEFVAKELLTADADFVAEVSEKTIHLSKLPG